MGALCEPCIEAGTKGGVNGVLGDDRHFAEEGECSHLRDRLGFRCASDTVGGIGSEFESIRLMGLLDQNHVTHAEFIRPSKEIDDRGDDLLHAGAGEGTFMAETVNHVDGHDGRSGRITQRFRQRDRLKTLHPFTDVRQKRATLFDQRMRVHWSLPAAECILRGDPAEQQRSRSAGHFV